MEYYFFLTILKLDNNQPNCKKGHSGTMRVTFSQKNFPDSYNQAQKNSILDDISKTRFALENAYAGFDYALDPDLIDCYIYEVNSLMKRYKFLLEQAEKMHLTEKSSI
ncbi:MAG TPA: DUF2508 family protein [Lachnospiraceae bacterium]|nr:DUF2508 family protein [Lachnospiraceae bacterium]